MSTINTTSHKMSKNIPNIVFFVPFSYLYKVRLGTLSKTLSLLVLYVIPTSFYYVLICGISVASIINYILAITIIYTIYEIGYIQNDLETTKKELNPSLRLDENNIQFYNKQRTLIYTTRSTIVLIFASILVYTNNFNISSLSFITSVVILLITFCIYNIVRNRWSLIIFSLLQILKYTPYLLFAVPNIPILYIILLLFCFPILSILERTSHPRFNIILAQKIIPSTKKLPPLRALYYIIISFVLIILTITNNFNILNGTPIYILAAYRTLLYLFYKPTKNSNYLIR